MRIALIAFHYGEYTSRLALALARDHDVLLLLGAENAAADLVPALRRQVEAKVEAHFIAHRKLRDPRIALTTRRIVRLVEQFRPDVVHFQETFEDYGVWSVLRVARNTPFVLTVHDVVAHSGADRARRRGWRVRLYLGQLRRRADRIVVHGARVRAEMLARSGWPPERVLSVMHGPLGDNGGEVASDPSGTTLLFFGRIEAYKGLGVLLDALDRLRDAPGPVRLVIAGQGTELERFRARIAASPNIELIDRYIEAEELPGLFRRCAVVVLPYLDASQSGVAAIAFNHRRPVIASAVGGLPDVVRPGVSGLLVPPADPAALALAIRQVLADPALLRRLAAGAGSLAAGELSWASVADGTAAAYRAACAGGHGALAAAT